MKSGISKNLFTKKWLINNWKILLVLLLILIVMQRCYFPIINEPELKGNTLPAVSDFTHAILQEYPLGSSEVKFIEELKKQEFRIWPERGLTSNGKTKYDGGASYEDYPGLPYPCSFEWRILWKSEDKKLTEVKGLFFSTCL